MTMPVQEDLPLPPQSEPADPPGLHDARGEQAAGGTYAQQSQSPAARRSLARKDQLEDDRSVPPPSDKECGEEERGYESVEDVKAAASSVV